MRSFYVVVAVWIGLGLGAGCAGGGGSGGGSTTSTSSTTSTNDAHWQTAMAALAQTPAPDPPRFDSASMAAFNDLIARSWHSIPPTVLPPLEQALKGALVGQGVAGVSVLAITNIQLDAPAAPAVLVTGSSALEVQAPPAPAAWTLGFSADVGGTIQTLIFGRWVSVPITVTIDVTANDLRIAAPVTFDLTNPVEPRVAYAGAPRIDLRLSVTSSSPIVSTLMAGLTQLLDPLVRGALVASGVVLPGHLTGLLQGVTSMQSYTWGRGGPPIQPVPNAAPLEPLAVEISETIQRDHMPHDQVFIAVYDQPHQGGNVVDHHGTGDAATWTGHYLASEAYRFDVTGDPRATAGAERVLRALQVQLDLVIPGLLARSVIPMGAPLIAQIDAHPGYYTGVSGGHAYGALGNVSRDAYIGCMLGLGQTFHRNPGLRGTAGPLVNSVLTYLEGEGWLHRHVTGEVAAWWFQAPSSVLGFTKIGARVDPRWEPLRQRYAALSELTWLNAWASTREIHEQFFKLNLAHSSLATVFEFETDPAAYRGSLRTLRILRDVIGHHQNAWFDAIFGMAVPTATGSIGPLVKTELDRWALRPRRGFSVTNSQDPSIQTDTYDVTAILINSGQPGAVPTTALQTKTFALFPVPIDKRVPTDFLWQTSPFELDRSRPPTDQYPGIDLVLPYWMARNHGLLQ